MPANCRYKRIATRLTRSIEKVPSIVTTFNCLKHSLVLFRHPKALVVLVLSASIGLARAASLEAARNSPVDLTELSLEELMNIEVTSVSRKPQGMSEAAAAIFVITAEDIRRSGVTSIPEALRMAPGIQVAHIDANKWAITARGFNDQSANKLLVLMDGRSVYTPLFSGVYWEVQDTFLEDIDRIEVIRGPGATLWGANAVNGVINIITKKARDTQGGLVSVGGGNEEQGFGGMRYGGKLSNDAYYRVYAKYFNRDHSVFASGEDANDDWDAWRSGFRIDWEQRNSNSLTLQGDIYDGKAAQSVPGTSLTPPFTQTFEDDADIAGSNILVRWSHSFSDTSYMDLQLYYDWAERKEIVLQEDRHTLDIDFQHEFTLGEAQEIIWGLGYRFTRDDIDNSFTVSFDPTSRDDQLFSGFLQDEITLVKDRLRLILGSKLEHNDYSGFEIQPNARIVWWPKTRHMVWASAARAVRTPSRSESDIRINFAAFPVIFRVANVLSIFGDRDFDSEDLTAYEFGYRFCPMKSMSLDIAAFYNLYDNLFTLEPGTPFIEFSPAPMHFVIPLTFDNKMDGETYGMELSAKWNVLGWLRLQLAYTYLEIQIHKDGDSSDTTFEIQTEKRSPDHQLSLRSMMNIGDNLEFDLWFRYVDRISDLDIGSCVTLDTRLGWRISEDLELSIVGQNLLDHRRSEFMAIEALPSEVERSVYGKITLRF